MFLLVAPAPPRVEGIVPTAIPARDAASTSAVIAVVAGRNVTSAMTRWVRRSGSVCAATRDSRFVSAPSPPSARSRRFARVASPRWTPHVALFAAPRVDASDPSAGPATAGPHEVVVAEVLLDRRRIPRRRLCRIRGRIARRGSLVRGASRGIVRGGVRRDARLGIRRRVRSRRRVRGARRAARALHRACDRRCRRRRRRRRQDPTRAGRSSPREASASAEPHRCGAVSGRSAHPRDAAEVDAAATEARCLSPAGRDASSTSPSPITKEIGPPRRLGPRRRRSRSSRPRARSR